jgi:hypothetical protein
MKQFRPNGGHVRGRRIARQLSRSLLTVDSGKRRLCGADGVRQFINRPERSRSIARGRLRSRRGEIRGSTFQGRE